MTSLDGIATELEVRADTATGDPSAASIGDIRYSIPEPRTVTYVDYDNPFSLVNQSLGTTPHIAQLSKNAWVGCGDDIYVLECMGKGHIRIDPVPGGEHDLQFRTPFDFLFPRQRATFPRTLHPNNSC